MNTTNENPRGWAGKPMALLLAAVFLLLSGHAYADTFRSAIRAGSGSVSLQKGTFGSWSAFEKKKYRQYNIVQLANAASTPARMCSIGPTFDKRLTPKWVSCETFEETGWRLQGITGSSGNGYFNRKDIILVSWHSGDDKHARITLINTTTRKQMRIALVAACSDSDAVCSLQSASDCGNTHAGGLAWYKMNLFVADSDCVIVFNLNKIYQLANGTYVMPSMHYWKRPSGNFTYSSIGIDTSGWTPYLLASEYETGGCGKTRFARFALNTSNAQPVLNRGSSNTATSDGYYTMPQCYAQGLAYYNGMWFFNTSGAGTDYMYRFRTSRHAPPDTAYLMPKNTPQGIFVDKLNGLFWALTESPNGGKDAYARIFSYPMSQVTR